MVLGTGDRGLQVYLMESTAKQLHDNTSGTITTKTKHKQTENTLPASYPARAYLSPCALLSFTRALRHETAGRQGSPSRSGVFVSSSDTLLDSIGLSSEWAPF